jgi:hypothetical protein
MSTYSADPIKPQLLQLRICVRIVAYVGGYKSQDLLERREMIKYMIRHRAEK